MEKVKSETIKLFISDDPTFSKQKRHEKRPAIENEGVNEYTKRLRLLRYNFKS